MTGDPLDRIAQSFHEAYERLAPEYGYETRKESAVPWGDVPANNRALMEAVVAEVCGPLVEIARAARDRYASGHNEWCDSQLSTGMHSCTCGHAEIGAALARLDSQ